MGTGVHAQSTWVKRPSNSEEFLGGVSHGNDTFVAVGDNGTIRTSSDGVTWGAADSGTAASLRTIIYSDEQFVVVGQSGTILTSPDGVSWTAQTSGVRGFLSGLAFSGSRYVAVGASGMIITSPDAITWTPVSSGTSRFLQGLSYAEGLFVAVGGGGTILTSVDGLAWNAPVSPTNSFLLASSFFGGRYYAVGLNGVLLSSPDGSSWSLGNSGSLNVLRSITSDGASAIICGESGTVLKSTDGIGWSPVEVDEYVILTSVTYANGKFVIVGEPPFDDAVVLVSEQDPAIRWDSSAISVPESAGSVVLRVARVGSTNSVASVDFQTTPGSASDNIDFIPAAGTASFAVGESSVEIVIPLANNPEIEPPESFTVTLSSQSPSGLLLHDPAIATVTIVDALDSDFDGLLDDWELLYFADVESFGPGDDPDGDGNSNLREFADETDPADTASASYRLTAGVTSGLGTLAVSPSLTTYPRGTRVALIPTASGEFDFVGWNGDASGESVPLGFEITSDVTIGADFEVSLRSALDDPYLVWTTGGSGPPWRGQVTVASDGADAAEAGGLLFAQQSSLETTVLGPAQIAFDWKALTSEFDSYVFLIDDNPQVEAPRDDSEWRTETFPIGAGMHTLRWTYSKYSSSGGGARQAWLDRIAVEDPYELWQLSYFDVDEREDPSISGPGGDPDQDGTPNLLEYVLNLHPWIPEPDSPVLPTVSIEEFGGQTVAALTWVSHRKRSANVLRTVEYSPSLQPGSWQTLNAPIQTLATRGGFETLRVTVPTPTSITPRGFLRLKVSLRSEE